MYSVLISVGTNHQRLRHAQRGLALLADTLTLVNASAWYVSAAVELAAAPYWNSMVEGRTHLTPDALKDELRRLEDQTGRVRRDPSGAKSPVVTLDLDIVAVEGRALDADLCRLPHLVVPLADLHPHWRDPTTGYTAQRLAWQHIESLYRMPLTLPGQP